MVHVEKDIHGVVKGLDWVAQGALVLIMLLSVANIISGYIWQPIFGTYELVSFLTLVALSFSIPYCAVQEGHVAVSFVFDLLPKKLQFVLSLCNGILGTGIFAVIGWQSAAYAMKLWQKGEVSGTLHLPLHPLVFGIGFGCFMLSIVLFIKFLKTVKGGIEG